MTGRTMTVPGDAIADGWCSGNADSGDTGVAARGAIAGAAGGAKNSTVGSAVVTPLWVSLGGTDLGGSSSLKVSRRNSSGIVSRGWGVGASFHAAWTKRFMGGGGFAVGAVVTGIKDSEDNPAPDLSPLDTSDRGDKAVGVMDSVAIFVEMASEAEDAGVGAAGGVGADAGAAGTGEVA
jgi:hypothetical protein